MQFTDEMMKLAERVEEKIKDRVRDIESIAEQNQWKVIQAFQRHQVSDFHFAGSTGYGYNDRGREVLDEVYADVFGAEAALVRPHFVSGTHTIATALFAVLRPGDELLYITGTPYDTLHKVIGQEGDGTGSLCDWGIHYGEVELTDEGRVDWAEVERRISPRTKVIGIQRSRGYAWRTSFRVDEIADMVARVKRMLPDAIVFVDNCYGEFTERLEPTEAGADLIAGSLIKNPGGGIAETGGYIAGKRRFVEAAAAR
ncbi:methionine gamma-lyase family protein, partial [Bacillus cereus]|nr:methionine gamma-lyase family protein [Bacillus cereus]